MIVDTKCIHRHLEIIQAIVANTGSCGIMRIDIGVKGSIKVMQSINAEGKIETTIIRALNKTVQWLRLEETKRVSKMENTKKGIKISSLYIKQIKSVHGLE
ncbi:MAG: hypothetical protein ACR5K2_02575 [Wolbachia sp.]